MSPGAVLSAQRSSVWSPIDAKFQVTKIQLYLKFKLNFIFVY